MLLSSHLCFWDWIRKVHKRGINHFYKQAKWLCCLVSIYSAFDYMFFSCNVRVSELIHNLKLPEFQGNPCSKQIWSLKLKLLQLESNTQPISSLINNEIFSQTSETIEVFCEGISVRTIRLYVPVMSRSCFRVIPNSIVAWMSRNSLLQAGPKSQT